MKEKRNIEMAYACSPGFLICIFVVLLTIEFSSAKHDEGDGGISRKCSRGTGNYATFHSDVDFLGGRNTLPVADEDEKPIYFTDKPAHLWRSSQELQMKGHYLLNAKNKAEMLKQNGMHHSTKKMDESEAFLAAAEEVANLMKKDYVGKDRPMRKPPINNHEPKD